MRMYKPVISALLFAALTGCAAAAVNSAESVSRLEEQQKASPSSAQVNRSLGIAYYKADRFPQARASLETAQRLDPKDGTTSLYLGLTDEALNDLPAARAAYSNYISVGRTSRVRNQLLGKLAELSRKEITADAKAALATEATLGTTAGNPRTVAVLPLRFSGADTSLKPLERGFADLLTTDLARSSQLTLVERSRMQALLDEIKLQQGGATDAATNVRAGKLVRAGRVVQGTLSQVGSDNLRVDAAVVEVPTSQISGSTNAADQLDAIFNLEKQVALNLFTQMGITLTVAERNQIEQRPTRSLAAFMAYSRGLTAEDEGRYDDASRFFGEAARIDPSYNQATQKSAETKQISAGATVTAATVETSLKGTSEGAVVSAAVHGDAAPPSTAGGSSGSGLGSTAQAAAGDLNTSTAAGATAGASSSSSSAATTTTAGTKDPVAAGTGSDNPSSTATVKIVVTRPKTP